MPRYIWNWGLLPHQYVEREANSIQEAINITQELLEYNSRYYNTEEYNQHAKALKVMRSQSPTLIT